MASSINADNSFGDEEFQQYPYPTDHVNTANFLSIKLSGETNYRLWREQMRCLLDSHDMLGFIDGTIKCNQGNREWERSDTLVKGWIFGSITEDLMKTVVSLHTSHQVWKQLKNNYDTRKKIRTHVNVVRFAVLVSKEVKYQPLYKAILNGHLEKAREYIIKDKDALTGKINDDDDSPLHVAIDGRHNIYFVEYLLKEINSESLPTLVCKRQQNPLHRAALVGNTQAAEMLVEKNPNLLFLGDEQDLLPIHIAIFGSHVNTFKYLLEVTEKNIDLSRQEGHENPFQGSNAAVLLKKIIRNGLFEDAYVLIKDYPEMARRTEDFHSLLKSIAGAWDAYFSGTKYNFYQKFVYHHVPIQDHNLDSAHEIYQDIENQVPDTTTPIARGRRSSYSDVPIQDHNLDSAHEIYQDIENQVPDTTTPIANGRRSSYSVIKWIYVKLWKVLLLHVAHVKRLHEDKMKHKKTLLLLKCICKEHQKIVEESDLFEHYREAILFALENDTREAIEEIIKSFPQAIWTKQNDLNLIQLSIVNRCEKVYSFLVHKEETVKLVHKILDEDGNNILHLVGKLAPIHRLNMVSGAALQMQKELQWFEEAKKLSLAKESKKKNKKQETPIMVFRREHKELRKEGEEWMKTTANSYTITAALIITIVFAAAITVPGGNDDNGKPNYTTNPGFIIFVVSNAISLFTATTSLLLCLSILTTRYRDDDFLYQLPKRLMLGLGMLFISVTSMTIAFSATLYIMFGHGKAWILFPIAALTCLPIISFVTLQLPLLFDLYTSTYGQGLFGKQSDDGKIKLQ